MMDSASIKHKFISGVIWGIIENLANLLAGFIITLVLARILTPADYGLVNMIFIFTVLGTVLLDGGFGQAIIQRQSISSTDISSVFYINLVLSIIIYTVLYISSPLIALFYNQPQLVNLSRATFLAIPISAFSLVQHSLLTKELKVKYLTYVSLISAILSGTFGIYLAYNGMGVWALVGQSLGYQVVRAISLWCFSKWRPVLNFNLTFIKSILGFSMNLLGVLSLAAIFQNIYSLLIGKFYNVNDVGYYNQAFRMQSVASNAVMSSVQRVAFPSFSYFQDDIDALKSAYRKVAVITMSIYFPIMMCLIVVSHNLFEVLLTDKWLPSVPLFCLLCAAEAFYPINNINSSILKALGRGKKYLRLNLLNYGIIVLSIVVTFKFGIIALLIGYAVSAILRSLTSMFVCGKQIKYSVAEQIKDLFPVFAITTIICALTYIPNVTSLSSVMQLILSIILGCAGFLLLNIITKSPAYLEISKIIKKKHQ